jgi:hypothetical protein
MPKIDKAALQKRWLHSREEDTESEKVFRPADYDFPLTRRPRESLDLKSDGSVSRGTAAPSDSLEQHHGKWTLDDDELTLYPESGRGAAEKLRIASISADRLVIKKE